MSRHRHYNAVISGQSSEREELSHECTHFYVHQVCGGVRRRRVHHLHCHGFEEQELRLSTGVCLGT